MSCPEPLVSSPPGVKSSISTPQPQRAPSLMVEAVGHVGERERERQVGWGGRQRCCYSDGTLSAERTFQGKHSRPPSSVPCTLWNDLWGSDLIPVGCVGVLAETQAGSLSLTFSGSVPRPLTVSGLASCTQLVNTHENCSSQATQRGHR